jgi:hypothetical protein
MKGKFLKGVFAGSLFSVVITATTVAFAGTGVGGVFNLGQKNKVDATTTLTGTSGGAMLHVTNKGTAVGANLQSAAGPAANFATTSLVPPFTVSSNVAVPNLNADLLDGKDSSAFQVHSAIHLVTGTPVPVGAGGNALALAVCADSEIAIAGGVRWDPVTAPAADLIVEMAGPSSRADGSVGGWRVDGHNGSAVTRNLISYALCIS